MIGHRFTRCSHWHALILCGLAMCSAVQEAPATDAAGRRLPLVPPDSAGIRESQLRAIEQAVAEALAEKRMPGCVVAVGRQGKLVYLRAFGNRQLQPQSVPMTTDTVFDLASLTKPIATATSVMKLVESGKVTLCDRVARYLPEFGTNGKDRITVYHLLTHQSGLTPDNALSDYECGAEPAWQHICNLSLQATPGERFSYSDVGYVVLGELVRRVSGTSLDVFARANYFEPLGMQETTFLPGEDLCERAAPTEQRDGGWMQGAVHDPRAYLLGGVAGHAGLFSTAEDLALYADMMLGAGAAGDTRVLEPRSVERMTASYPVMQRSGQLGLRGLGWDKRTGYSSNRGDGFTEWAFGHGGFTGTAIWIDPGLDLFVIFLSNRVHPDGTGAVNPLAGAIGSIAAAAIQDAPAVAPKAHSSSETLCGIDVLRRDQYALLAGKRVGLITNQTGIARDGTPTIQLLHAVPEVQLVRLFSPEHGIAGNLDIPRIDDGTDGGSGVEIVSLYGETRRPTAESLQGIDVLVFDIQDIGTRFYTYISTMGHAMQAAAEHGLPFVVLDRPNPINGVDVAGPVLDEGSQSFVGFHTLPVRHGMTIGELAELFRYEFQWDLDLQVVPLEGWQRSDYFDRTGLLWVNPSPNMRSLTQALLYPGIGLLEMTNLSVGRGTDTPFELVGAPWIDAQMLAQHLNTAQLPGVRFVPLRFTPDASKFAGQPCGGVNILITDRHSFEPMAVGFELARQLRLLYPDQWEREPYNRLLCNRATWEAVMKGQTREELENGYRAALERFLVRRAAWLLYD